MPTTFKVDAVSPAELRNLTSNPSVEFKNLCSVLVEASGASSQQLIGQVSQIPNVPLGKAKMGGFLRAVHEAYANHFPLTLSPDDIWLAIAQGFSYHVNANAEELRDRFVSHQRQATIKVRRDGFVKGSPSNDWPGCFSEFSEQIARYIGTEQRNLISSDFSTSTPLTRAVSQVTLMDTLKAYFQYVVVTRCGIPSITLLGTEDDWSILLMKAIRLADFGCRDWIRALLIVLNNFVYAFKGLADPKFWSDIYKVNGPHGSGGTSVTGWINVFYPYLNNWRSKGVYDRPNPAASDLGYTHGVAPDQYPTGLTSTPFIWDYYETLIPMQFLAGFIGATQDPTTKAISPVQGWGVANAE